MPEFEYMGPLQTPEYEFVGPLKQESTLDKIKGGVSKFADTTKEYYDYLHTPTAPPASVGDFVTRVIPESVSKTTVGALEFLPKTAVDLSEGAGKALNRLTKGQPAEAFKEAVEPVANLSEGIKQFVGRPTGFYGKEPLKEAWTTDPAGSLMAVSPTFKGVKRGFRGAREGIKEATNFKGVENVLEPTKEIRTARNIPEYEYIAPLKKPPVNYDTIIDEAAGIHGVDPDLVKAVVKAESAGKKGAVSPKGAQGLMQIMPGTAEYLGLKPGEVFIPEKNIDAGVRYLKEQLNRYNGDEAMALAAYNWGPGRVDRLVKAGKFSIDKLPQETQNYIKKISKGREKPQYEYVAPLEDVPDFEPPKVAEAKAEAPVDSPEKFSTIANEWQKRMAIANIEGKPVDPVKLMEEVKNEVESTPPAPLAAEPVNAVDAKSGGSLKQATIADEAVNLSPLFQALDDIKASGGLSYDALAKDYGKAQITELVRKRPGLVSKKGKATLDTVADTYGFPGGDELLQEILGAKSKKSITKDLKTQFEDAHYDDIRLAKKGFEKTDGIYPETLDTGDKVLIKDESFTVKGYDKDGRVILKDGETLFADPFEKLDAEGIKRATPKAEKPKPETTAEKRGLEYKGGIELDGEYYHNLITNPRTGNKAIPIGDKGWMVSDKKNKVLTDIISKEKAEEILLGKKPKPEETAELPGMGFRDTFDLTSEGAGDVYKGPLPEKAPAPRQTTIDLTSGIDPTKAKEILSGLKEDISQTLPGRAFKEVINKLHSPEVVFNKMGEKGREIYKTADHFEMQKNHFLAREGGEFEKVTKGVKIDSPESVKVGQALDGKIDPSALTSRERQVYDWMKEKYQFFLQEAAKSAAGSAENFKQALNYANRKVKPMSKVMDLTEGEKQHYKGIKTPPERIDYLHEKWRQSTDEGIVKAYDILSREIKEYLPHIFDKDALLEGFKVEIDEINNKLRTATNDASVNQFKERLKQLEDSVKTIEGGGFVRYSQLPRNIRFRFFETRKGAQGYSFDAVKAYQTYLTGVARKIYDEPAMQKMTALYKDLPPEYKAYADEFLRRYSGINERGALNELANTVASFQWMRTLGLNPRSALVNLTQRVNTIAEVGPQYSLKGEKMAFTEKGKQLFDETGLPQEIPQVLYEGSSPKMEKLRSVLGFMFNRVEMGNRRHAFLSGYLKGKEKLGMSEAEAIQYGIDTVHKTQFKYGKVGMPLAMSTPLGRTALQFWSYPIKQLELMHSWAKNDPKKLVYFLAMAEGGNLVLQNFLDTDLSNALGLGWNWGEALNAFKDLSKGDFREFFRHGKLVMAGGGGVLPSGLGPTASSLYKIAEGIPEGKGTANLVKELTPVAGKRAYQAYQAVKEGENGEYPLKDSSGHPYQRINARQLIQRTIGPKTQTESKSYLEHRAAVTLEQERKEILKDITNAILDGKDDKAETLMNQYGIKPTREQVRNEAIKRVTTAPERRNNIGKKEKFQYQQEGRIY